MFFRISLALLLALALTGCADLTLPASNRIYEERTALSTTTDRLLVVADPMDWSTAENGNHYKIQLPPGTYHVEAHDEDYLYYQAPEPVSLGETKLFSNQDSRSYEGGLFISRNPHSKYSSGAYIDDKSGKKLLLFFFDSRFNQQEGKRWHYVE